MAVIWSVIVDTGIGFPFGSQAVGYHTEYAASVTLGNNTISDSTVDFYSGATIRDLYTISNILTFRVSGNQTGVWTHVRIGYALHEYADFTRVYDATNNWTTFTKQPFAVDTITFPQAPNPMQVRVRFYDAAPTESYGIRCQSSNQTVGFTADPIYTSIIEAGTTTIPANGTRNITANGIDSGFMTNMASADAQLENLSTSVLTNTLRFTNSSSVTKTVGYVAFRFS